MFDPSSTPACPRPSIATTERIGHAGAVMDHAAVALMLHSVEDRRIAEDLSMNRVIGVELGLERWAAMQRDAAPLGDDRYRVSLDARRGAISRSSRENRSWNLRTLSLMMRAGLIRLDAEPPPARG